MSKKKEKLVESKDSNDNEVRVILKRPSIKDMRDSQIVYNKSFKDALDGGAILKKKLNAYISEQDIWDDEKEKRYNQVVEEMQSHEGSLRQGGIPLAEARGVALKLRVLRNEFRNLIAERSEMDSNTAESIADNSRFNFLVTRCITDEGNKKVFSNEEDYDGKADEPWAFEAAAELANILYELDPDFNKNLEENKFLFNYKFCNNDLQLVNKEKHLIDGDDEGVERLISKEGRYVAYRGDDDSEVYFVNKKGEEVDEEGNALVDFAPFLDEDGKPVVLETEGDSEEEGTTEEETVAEESTEEPKKPRKRASASKKTTEAG